MAFQIEFNIGEDKAVYDRLIAAIPPGQDNLVGDVIVPAHTPDKPISLTIKNVVPDVPHIVHVTSEWGVPPTPTIGFVPKATEYTITLALPYGPCVLMVQNSLGSITRTQVTVTNYAIWFRAEAREITEHSIFPITTLDENVKSSVAYILATPLIANVNRYVPTDLEILGTLANKLLVKNLLWRPGTDAGARELLAAFGASNPVFFPMLNLGSPETPLYRSEEVFSGFEAHMWLPNREVERWSAFIQYLNNLPQLYSLKEVTEGIVYVQVGNRIHQHVFDFESDFANTVLEGKVGDECFERLFRLDMTFDAEVIISFCQASYTLDNTIPFPGLETPDTDLLSLTNFRDWSLTGRFEQQFDITYDRHYWKYDSPVFGIIDGTNRFFSLSEDPASSRSVKLFLDGLLLKNLIDYRISTGDDFRSGIYQLPISPDPILLTIDVGDPRPFIGPVFSTLEVFGGANLQYLVTATDQTSTSVSFVVSHPPVGPGDPQEARLHYVAPALLSNAYGGANQYGTETFPSANLTGSGGTWVLTFPTPATDINYQLFVQYAEDPMTGPTQVNQPTVLVRNHNLTQAIIEFSDPITAPNAVLHWWLIEADSVALERGTVTLNDGDNTVLVPFANAYLDQVVVVLQLWNTTSALAVPMPFVSFNTLTGFSFTVDFSANIEGSDYRLDYAVFPSEAGNLIEIFAPPQVGQLVEAHFDTVWSQWAHTGPSQQPDGLLEVFTLPFPCPNPKSMYATLDGRLLTQGNDQQYVVETPTRVRLTFVPQTGQKLWFVYPIAEPFTGEQAGGEWHQGFLNRQPDVQGAYAFGTIENAGRIAPLDAVEFRGVQVQGIQTARGVVTNPLRITPSDSVVFNTLGVTFTGVLYTSFTPPTPLASFTPSDVNTATDEITVAGHGLLSNTIVYFYSTDTLPAGLSTYTRYYVVNPTVNTFQLSTSIAGPAIDLTSTGVGSHTLATGALPTEFKVGQSPDLDGLSLAAVINSYPATNSIYFAEYTGSGQTEIRAKYLGGGTYNETLTILGLSMTAANIVGDTVSSPGNYFPCDVSQALDSAALSTVINENPVLNKIVQATYTTGVVSLTAKHIGGQENGPITILGASMITHGMSGGISPQHRLPMLSYKPFYYRDAPVVAIDGVSTRLYNAYGANSIQFDTIPVPLQEPYIISQVYPTEHFPLDSMAANQPCSYPKGNYTQGLSAQLTEIDVEVEQEATLVISVNNLPLQEEPIGPVDGANVDFDLTLESCAGQDSLMFWIDGIFQNPTQYTYSVNAGHGVITTSQPPQPGQKLWVWYLPQGDACAEEHVVQMTGTYDGVNQTFGIPDSPFVNKPAFVAFLDGLFQLQQTDYVIDTGNMTMTYLGALAPDPGQQLWAHFNEGNIGLETWRQITVATGDGSTTTFTIPFLLTSELPTSQDSVILALNGLVQRENIDFTVNLGLDGFPDGTITFAQVPEAGRRIDVAYIRRA